MKPLWCSTIAVLVALVASWSVKTVGGMHTAVTLYDMSPCLPPATSMFLSRELTCTPVSSDDAHACEFNGVIYSVTNCTEYFSGWDTHGLIRQAFGDYDENPYLLVEEHDPSARYCGDSERVINATLHLLDERCHVSHDGTASSKISLGRWLTLAKYSDPMCSNILEMTDVPYGESYDRACANNATKYTYVGPRPPMSAVAVYEDSSCSIPVKLALTQGFVCKEPYQSCARDGNAHYSVSSCSSDYKELASAAFGDTTPFVMEEHFTSSWCGSDNVDAVMVYALDNLCHANADDTTSFRATLDSEGSVTITTFKDTNCELVESSVDITKRTQMCLPQRDCTSDLVHGCAKRYSVGGRWGHPLSNGQMSAVAVYNKGECSRPATTLTFTREITCGSQITNSSSSNSNWSNSESKPVCGSSGVGSSLTGCTFYYSGWDTSGMISQAFGSSEEYPYLLVEQYDLSALYCGDGQGMINATLHLLDETCHLNPDGTSSQITLGHWLTIAEYSDSQCTNVVAEAVVPYGDPWHRACANNATSYRYVGPKPSMSAVAVYEDSSCSTPVKLTLAQGFVCEADKAPDTMTCAPDGNSHYSVSNCSSDYKELASAVFSGGESYVMVEEFTSAWCGYADADSVTVYAMDNKCHSNTDDTTSFRASRSADGSTTIATYADANCETIESSTDFTKRSRMCLPQRNCGSDFIHGCAKRFSVGGDFGAPIATLAMTAVAVYEGGSCKAPASTLTFSRELTCSPLPAARDSDSNSFSSDSNHDDENNDDVVCEYNGIANTITDCTDYYSGWDTSRMFTRAFGWHGDHPYLLVEQYDPSARFCGDDYGVLNATVYILDESCHVNRDGTASSKLTLGRWLTITEYSDPQCTFTTSEVVVPFGDPYFRACTNNATRYSYVGPPPPMSVVAVYEDSSCSANPVKLTMTQGFACEAERYPEKKVCGPDGNSHYSVSSCSSDYTAFASATFWSGAPYVMVEEFTGDWCRQYDVDAVTVYTMDDTCHTDTNDATSFRATLASDGSASITTYADTNCERVRSSMDFTKRSQMCLLDRNCGNDVYDCAKRYSVGNLANTTARAQESVVVVYEDSTCTSAPAELILKEQASCSSSVAATCSAVGGAQDALSYSSECVDDAVAFVAFKFDGIPHLIMEMYASETNCRSREATIVWNADGRCHRSMDAQTYFQVSLGMDNSVTLATFPNAYCRDSEANYITVESKYLNTGTCFGGSMRIYTDLTTLSTPPVEYQTREEIMFPAWLWEPRPRRIFESD